MARATTYLILTLLFSGCAANQVSKSSDGLGIGRVRIDAKSKHMDGSVEMITRCSGFILTEKQVRDFLTHAVRIKDSEPDKYYRILPCSATGIAIIDKRKYNWVIRAGGVGEFFNDKDRFIEICGKNCCDKVPGIC